MKQVASPNTNYELVQSNYVILTPIGNIDSCQRVNLTVRNQFTAHQQDQLLDYTLIFHNHYNQIYLLTIWI